MSLPNCFPSASKTFVPNPWVAQNSYRTMPQPPRECRRPWESGEGLRVAAASEAGDQLRRSDVFLSDPPCGIDGLHFNFDHGHMSWMDEHLENVCECYAPEPPAIGIQRRDFVGWTGLAPTSLLMENVFGLRANALSNTLFWNIISRMDTAFAATPLEWIHKSTSTVRHGAPPLCVPAPHPLHTRAERRNPLAGWPTQPHCRRLMRSNDQQIQNRKNKSSCPSIRHLLASR